MTFVVYFVRSLINFGLFAFEIYSDKDDVNDEVFLLSCCFNLVILLLKSLNFRKYKIVLLFTHHFLCNKYIIV